MRGLFCCCFTSPYVFVCCLLCFSCVVRERLKHLDWIANGYFHIQCLIFLVKYREISEGHMYLCQIGKTYQNRYYNWPNLNLN